MAIHLRSEAEEDDRGHDLTEDVVEHHALEDIRSEGGDANQELHVRECLGLARIDHVKQVQPGLLLLSGELAIGDVGGALTKLVYDDALGELVKVVHRRSHVVDLPVTHSVRVSERVLRAAAEWLIVALRVHGPARDVNTREAWRTRRERYNLARRLGDAGHGREVRHNSLGSWGAGLERTVVRLAGRVEGSSPRGVAASPSGIATRIEGGAPRSLGALRGVAADGSLHIIVHLASRGPGGGSRVGREHLLLLLDEGARIGHDVIFIIIDFLRLDRRARLGRREVGGYHGDGWDRDTGSLG